MRQLASRSYRAFRSEGRTCGYKHDAPPGQEARQRQAELLHFPSCIRE